MVLKDFHLLLKNCDKCFLSMFGNPEYILI